ncbi:SatD family protein [Dethiobacter alkaliphilus]|uniref:SatD family protein n=1 Tax=Dethiobacter alkaliphilus TaxID=427926 RepID=UPI00222689A5|nr:SatD family protein [Dethiobacter alkaliphilus]MCW3490504.1 SatD family protein [Dethiobacter alkaliphilus]
MRTVALYGAVILDLVGSKRSTKRNQLQANLNEYITSFNQRFADILAAPATITVGDEWQVLTNQSEKVYHIVETFQRMFWMDGVELYAGMGIGELSTTLTSDIRNLDGPCFHQARTALETAKKQNHSWITSKRNRIFFADNSAPLFTHEIAATKEESAAGYTSFTNTLPEIINNLIENNEILKSKMTVNQKQVFLHYLKFGSYRKIAEETDKKSISNISERLNSAEVFAIQRNGYMIEKLLSYFLSERR